MANIGALLKQEIQRLARKEARGEAGGLRKALVRTRQTIVDLRKRIGELEAANVSLQRQIDAVRGAGGARPAAVIAMQAGGETSVRRRLRFSPEWLSGERTRLGLSALEFANLVGVSDQTIYNWEQGKVAPRERQLAVLATLRGLSKRAARARLGGEAPAQGETGGARAPGSVTRASAAAGKAGTASSPPGARKRPAGKAARKAGPAVGKAPDA